MKVAAIVPAAGIGKRLGSSVPQKPYVRLRGAPLIIRTLRALASHPDIKEVVLVVRGDKLKKAKTLLKRYGLEYVRIGRGGRRREDSVRNALAMVSPGAGYILIHDGSRPCIEPRVINRTLLAARRHGAAICGVPVKATLKIVRKGVIKSTPDRSTIWEAQTPQVFRRDIIESAYKRRARSRSFATDDAMLVEEAGFRVRMVKGSYKNIKITTPEDLLLADILMRY